MGQFAGIIGFVEWFRLSTVLDLSKGLLHLRQGVCPDHHRRHRVLQPLQRPDATLHLGQHGNGHLRHR